MAVGGCVCISLCMCSRACSYFSGVMGIYSVLHTVSPGMWQWWQCHQRAQILLFVCKVVFEASGLLALEQRTSCLIERGRKPVVWYSQSFKIEEGFFNYPLRLISVVHLQYSSSWNKSTLFVKVNLGVITLSSTDERTCDPTLVVAQWISSVKMSFLFMYWNITLVTVQHCVTDR